MRKELVLHVSLDRAWVVPIQHKGVYGRGHYRERDERHERAYQHDAKWRLVLWCQEDHKRKRCNTLLAQVMATSEGDLWEAWIEGLNEWDAAFRKMAPPGTEMPKEPAELYSHHVWLDDGNEPLMARCRHHGPTFLERSDLANALANGKRHGHRRGGRLIFG